MKRILLWCSLGVVLAAMTAWSQAGDSAKAVADLEQTWLKSQQTNNTDLIVPHLADRFIETESDGKVIGKTEAIAESKKMKYTSAEYEDVKVTVFGNTAIATGAFKGKGTDSQGKPFDTHERWTDTWIKMPSGKWQCVATQATPLKM